MGGFRYPQPDKLVEVFLEEAVLPVVGGRALPESLKHCIRQKLFRGGNHNSLSLDYAELRLRNVSIA